MVHADIAQYLSPEYPRESNNESSAGLEYRYLVDRRAFPFLQTGLPLVGDLWDRGLAITSVQFTPRIGNSEFHLLEISTIRSITGSESTSNLETELEEVRYQIRWLPNSQPLLKHPAFSAFGPDELEQVIGWENEVSESVKAASMYYPRDYDGNITTSVAVAIDPETPVGQYVKLRLLGHENYIFHAPNWTKVSVFKGASAPGTGSIGQKETPSGFGFPSGWEWVKTDDSAERIGSSLRWQRTETWTGAKKVDYDVDTLFTE